MLFCQFPSVLTHFLHAGIKIKGRESWAILPFDQSSEATKRKKVTESKPMETECWLMGDFDAAEMNGWQAGLAGHTAC